MIYHGAAKGVIVNRGFLNGPVCPVYGVGVLTVLAVINLLEQSSLMQKGSDPYDQSYLMLFLFGFVLATVVELVAGYLLDVIFHMKWWDYSNVPLNFHGYICLPFSIIWGLLIAVVIRHILPLLDRSRTLTEPGKYGWPVVAVCYGIFVADVIVTSLVTIGLNKKLEKLDELSAGLRVVSDKMSTSLGETSLKASQDISENAVQISLAKAELKDNIKEIQAEKEKAFAEKKRMIEEMRRQKIFGTRRLVRAFPDISSRDHNDALEELKEAWVKRKKAEQ